MRSLYQVFPIKGAPSRRVIITFNGRVEHIGTSIFDIEKIQIVSVTFANSVKSRVSEPYRRKALCFPLFVY